MEANEIMVNNEVMEAAEEIVTTSSGSSLKKVAGVGLALLACGAAYKYMVKPAIAKMKAKKEQEAAIEVDSEELIDNDVEDVEETE